MLCAPLIAAHEALVHFCADIVSIGVISTSPTLHAIMTREDNVKVGRTLDLVVDRK